MPKCNVVRCISCSEDHVVKSDAATGESQCRSCRVGKRRSRYCHMCNKMYGPIIKRSKDREATLQELQPRSGNHETCQSDLDDYTSWVDYMNTNPSIWKLCLIRRPNKSVRFSAVYDFQKYRVKITDLGSNEKVFMQHNSSYLPYLETLWLAYLTYLPPPSIMLTSPNAVIEHWRIQEQELFYWNGYQYYRQYGDNIHKYIETQRENSFYEITIKQIAKPSSKWFQLRIINPRTLSRKLNCLDQIPIEVRKNIIAKMVGHLSIKRPHMDRPIWDCGT